MSYTENAKTLKDEIVESLQGLNQTNDELEKTKAELEALKAENAMLMECVLEMSEIVYA